ncbi:NAD(+) synthase [candidate division WOR-1 bacterium RIFCSPLOWO2_02_FULL_46_20]|uniref:NH(3)-dependent NAD(+) synthetase n=2 Tax=Saganbacteria TaxID=1703751 RepID=A0A1F4REN6_UNCSA|nr:MAG: NAD(+) synthase [candidate division WOR-1 bacterium RIFCSPHIGHO2_02_FULL_45_12]OGC06650.1 MAG: NAD(+) synthase [candidate division WOR-1 bacterium RIFCSPLOWO2_02_FULL_46_20]OGC09694.1 MAG: NAD(+) synthase [candidate division WOR-1 bacterium RIFCSPLOWO2_12_FULL_45_9]
MIDRLVAWIKNQVNEAAALGCVFGLSGGVDSAVVGALCKKALPDNVLGLYLPCFSQDQDLTDAKAVADKFSIPTKLVDLQPVCDQLYQQLEGKAFLHKDKSLTIANLKPRLRMVSLYYQANKLNYLVVGTGNRSEAVMGYFTKYGDGGVDLLPLGELLKSQVRELARKLGVPQQIIDKPPSAGLWSGQTDEEELGITYEELDKIIRALDSKETKGLNIEKVALVKRRIQASAHKLCPPPVYKP